MDTLLGQFPLLLGMPEATSTSGAAGGGGQLVSLLVTFGLIIVIFYFLIIRPQSRKQKDTQKMLSALKKGDKVATAGGIRGIIHSVKEDSVIIRVDDNTKLEFSRSAVTSVLSQAEGDAAPAAKDKASRKGKSADKAPSTEAADEGTEAETADGNGSGGDAPKQ
jgi:preprotein translocase subunit YajC